MLPYGSPDSSVLDDDPKTPEPQEIENFFAFAKPFPPDDQDDDNLLGQYLELTKNEEKDRRRWYQNSNLKRFLEFFGFLSLAILLTIGIWNIASVAISLIYLIAVTTVFTTGASLIVPMIIPPNYIFSAVKTIFLFTLPFNVFGLILFFVITLASVSLPILPWILVAIAATSFIIAMPYAFYLHYKNPILQTVTDDESSELDEKESEPNLAVKAQKQENQQTETLYVARCDENGLLRFETSKEIPNGGDRYSEPHFKKTLKNANSYIPIKNKVETKKVETKNENPNSYVNYFVYIKVKPEGKNAYTWRFVPISQLLNQNENEVFVDKQPLFKQGPTTHSTIPFYVSAHEDFKGDDDLYVMRIVKIQYKIYEVRYIKVKDANDVKPEEPRYKFDVCEFKQVTFLENREIRITSPEILNYVGHDLTENEFKIFLDILLKHNNNSMIQFAKEHQEKWQKSRTPLTTLQGKNPEMADARIEKANHRLQVILKQLPDIAALTAVKEQTLALIEKGKTYVCPFSRMVPDVPVYEQNPEDTYNDYAEDPDENKHNNYNPCCIYSKPYSEVKAYSTKKYGPSLLLSQQLQQTNTIKKDIDAHCEKLEDIANQLRNLIINSRRANTIEFGQHTYLIVPSFEPLQTPSPKNLLEGSLKIPPYSRRGAPLSLSGLMTLPPGESSPPTPYPTPTGEVTVVGPDDKPRVAAETGILIPSTTHQSTLITAGAS